MKHLLRRISQLGADLTFLGIPLFIRDPFFTYQNFLPIGPKGLVSFPYDLVLLAVFGLAIFLWAYKSTVLRGP